MTPDELIREMARLGIRLEVRGDQLHVEARPHVLTPELRDSLVQHKRELLARLAPPLAFVTLKDGPTLPVDVIRLAISLEARGFRQTVDANHAYQIEPTRGSGPLTDADRASIARWKPHLASVIAYQAPTCG